MAAQAIATASTQAGRKPSPGTYTAEEAANPAAVFASRHQRHALLAVQQHKQGSTAGIGSSTSGGSAEEHVSGQGHAADAAAAAAANVNRAKLALPDRETLMRTYEAATTGKPVTAATTGSSSKTLSSTERKNTEWLQGAAAATSTLAGAPHPGRRHKGGASSQDKGRPQRRSHTGGTNDTGGRDGASSSRLGWDGASPASSKPAPPAAKPPAVSPYALHVPRRLV